MRILPGTSDKQKSLLHSLKTPRALRISAEGSVGGLAMRAQVGKNVPALQEKEAGRGQKQELSATNARDCSGRTGPPEPLDRLRWGDAQQG